MLRTEKLTTENTIAMDDNATKSLIASGKDLLALLRDSLVFLIGLLLIFFPSCLNDRLSKAGFQEGEIMGLKWKSSLVQSDQALKEMTITDSLLRIRNDSLSRLLTQIAPQITDRVVKAEIKSLQASNDQLQQAAAIVQSNAQNVIAGNSIAVAKAQKAVNEGEQWGVVFGADADLPGAKYERDVVAPKFKMPAVNIYLRQGFYRSVSIVGSQSDAASILVIAKSRRSDAYVVPMSTWCPNPVKAGDYLVCPTGN